MSPGVFVQRFTINSKMEVCASGPVWSSLVLELVNSKGDSEGFLIGEVSGRAVSNISDSLSQHLTYERVSTIQGLLPCNHTFSFYDSVGRIDHQKLQDSVWKHDKHIIGWYKFRRNTQQLVSMRERHIHHNLIKKLKFKPCKDFLFIVFTASIETGLSVHSINYTIFSSSSLKSSFENRELKVVNLCDTSHSEYRQKPNTIRTSSRLLEDVTDAYREDFMDQDGCLKQPLATHSMYISLVTKMKDILNNVKDSESTVSVMVNHVDSLREKVQKLKDKDAEKRRKLEESNVETAELIDFEGSGKRNDSINTERIVEGAEGCTKPSHHKQQSRKPKVRHIESMDTDTLIDLSDDRNDKRPLTRSSLPLNGSKIYQDTCSKENSASNNNIDDDDDDDDDDTQDYSLPDDGSQK